MKANVHMAVMRRHNGTRVSRRRVVGVRAPGLAERCAAERCAVDRGVAERDAAERGVAELEVELMSPMGMSLVQRGASPYFSSNFRWVAVGTFL
jgi:hypothetical protein